MNSEPYSGTQAVQRAVAVLQAFGPGPELLSPQEISRRTGLHRSTVYRLLSALEQAGMVVPEAAGYRLGPELIALGGLALRQIDMRAQALPALHRLARSSGETVDLEVLRGEEMLVIEEIASDHLLGTSSNIGMHYPAHCTATGKALLALLPAAARDAWLSRDLARRGPRSLTDPAALRADLERVRQRGYATSYEELESHLHAIGAAIVDHQGAPIAAVSVSGPAARLPPSREAQLAAQVQAACDDISRLLGWRGARATPTARAEEIDP